MSSTCNYILKKNKLHTIENDYEFIILEAKILWKSSILIVI